ncbi:hypothetical protein AMS68_002846 [Peltaster fructicola]|uniref:Bms1-type G domain-containing protein n=1 Tax=Peltaster fructicola TaxID=286661 RepID=A0A6H0XRS5_9PEZI|nr:hypothetical protein AMS68_002846 [Peltaster fructicola]
MGAPTGDQHHHRSTTKQSHKPFKSRHASKSELKERSKGKVERLETGARRTPQQQMLSKLGRRNQAKQKRINHAAKKDEENSVFNGRDGAPRVIAIVPLCQDIDTHTIAKDLNLSVEVDTEAAQGHWRVEIPRFKQRVQYLTPKRDLFATLDACRVADFVLFVLSAEAEVDQLGEQMLKCIESQGVSTVITGVHNLSTVEPAKRRTDVLKSLKSFITHFFATQEKVHDLANRQECSNIMRSLCTTAPKGVRWREDRSWMVVEGVKWQDEQCTISGVVRGRNLKADRLVQVGDWGDFKIAKITAASLQTQKKHKSDAMVVDDVDDDQILELPSEEQDDLDELAPEDTIMDDGTRAQSTAYSDRKHVLLDDHTYHDEDDEDEVVTAPKRLPRGTSKYQAAWYLDNVSDSGSDMEDVEEEDEFDGLHEYGPADGHFDAAPEPTEGAPSEYPQSEMFDDRAPEDEADQLEAYRKQRREEAENDLEFPDEIELHPHGSARERLAKYRGLKSLRTSNWDAEEDLPFQPETWDRLLEIADPKAARNRVMKDALIGGVKAGQRVDILLQIQPEQVAELQALPTPTSLFSLLKHEHKRTVINVSMTLPSDYPAPLKSKTELILQCGPRRLRINPLFSQAGNTPNNVHKFERYLHPGRTAVASFIGPVCWGSVPCIYFMPAQNGSDDAVEDLAQAMADSGSSAFEPIATGTLLAPSTSRVIAKRIILAGHPYKIHKRVVTIRYMFFNNEDVEYFKSLPLWTRRGRSGYIKETLGTHGYFKATFDGKINPMDSVGISLYKRVWPRAASLWRAEVSETGDVQMS